MLKRILNMQKTKHCIFVSCFFVLGSLLLPGSIFAQQSEQNYYYEFYGWQMDAFDSEIEIREDATLFIKETISTTFNPDFGKHGIFREIPVRYKDDLNNNVNINLQVQSITQNGEPIPYKISQSGPYKRIRIGDPDVTISGEKIYEITYTVSRAMLYFDDYDELYNS